MKTERPIVSQLQKHPSIWHRIVSVVLAFANIIAAIGLTISAYSGSINPIVHPTAPAIAMTFPIWLIGAIILLIISLFIRIRLAAIIGLGIIASLPTTLNFSPLHLPKHASDNGFTFTVMSYNVLGLEDQNKQYFGDINPTLSYILNQDPDIVCLQEMPPLHTSSRLHITAAQIDSIHCQYPYVLIASKSQAIFSKFPVEPIQMGFKYSGESGSADMACFRAEIKGQKVTIFNVHLQSFSLVDEDKEMFKKLTRLKGSETEIAQMRSHLVNKIREAAPQRVLDTEELIKYIRKFGGPNVIVCGDFNDVPGSYPLRMLADEHLKEVYPEVGFGPMITYNANRFYFRIDHILYRGDLTPLSMKRGAVKSSDHYPVIATFEIPDN
ncbi:MAG: endonuclease/exonuclease/phosphatase family protein [Muribaculaceae bacterium]|nr:endonuclease/exonuclease/phosphatase family protein [Muribaculaceae bacterium]